MNQEPREPRPPGSVRIPSSTYRLQLGRNFTFKDARAIIAYLAKLGVSDCYLSPFLQPCQDDSSGYDIADHNRVNAAIGGEVAYEAFAETLAAHGLGQLIDVVPNHMGISGGRNAWWLDVLEHGPASQYAAFFDIDWDPVKPELKDRVLLPILGDPYGRALEHQDFQLEFRDGAFAVRYHDVLFPIGPRTYAQILGYRLDELEATRAPDDPGVLELRSIFTATTHLPPRTEANPERRVERSRETQSIKRRLERLVREDSEIQSFVEHNVRLFNGIRGVPESFDRLDALLNEQPYQVAFWRAAADEINYRRFFDVNELAAIRMEEPAVFEATHQLIFRLILEGWVTGLRIDHPDGLYAPAQYLRNLQRGYAHERSQRVGATEAMAGTADAALEAGRRDEGDRPDAEEARSRLSQPFYIVAEKILMGGEALPEDWPVHGTTGYEFLNALNGIFVDATAAGTLTQTYRRFTGVTERFEDLVYETKKLIMDTSMASELRVLGHQLARFSHKHRASRDFTDRSLTDALREVIACFPVYRTYIGEGGFHVSDRDRRYIEQAVGCAKRRNATTSASVFDFIRDVLCLRFAQARNDADRLEELAFVMKFQQLTAPITAKGVEDTAFYRDHRLVSLNEVGGTPERFGGSIEEFHRQNEERLARWPGALSATSTHDTKRSEDVRARINVLSELPHEWRARVRTWHRLNRRHRQSVDSQPAPDRNEEYLLYQTLVGAWPLEPPAEGEHKEFTERIQQYMLKAVREAKVHGSWINPRPDYDAAVRQFVAAILDEPEANPFLADFLPFQARVATWGMYNALSQTLLKLAAPGVPDIYQGTELWELSLVDPDNRRPVDYARRRAMLEDLTRELAQPGVDLAALARALTATKADGRIKLYVLHQGLTYRRARPRLFLEGTYVPLSADGLRQDHVVAFARQTTTETVVAVAPRFLARLGVDDPPLGAQVWAATWLALPPDRPGRRYRNLFTGEAINTVERARQPALPLDTVFASFPVALLEREVV